MVAIVSDQQDSLTPWYYQRVDDTPDPHLALALEQSDNNQFWITLETPGPEDEAFSNMIDRVVNSDQASREDKVSCLQKIAEASFPNSPEHQALGMVWLQAG